MTALPALPGLKVLSQLGEGGMGTVYKALDGRLGRTVAVKVLAAHLASDPAFVTRFLREARYLAQVRHDSLVTIYDVVTAGATPYFVMEHVEGDSLAGHLEARGPLPWNEAWRLLDPILAAVAAIHGAGLVHRDLKPGNVLLDKEGRAKVMDFGLAKGLSDAALTQEGVILGTPEYMAPEQAKGDAVGPPADVYALGVLAYRMVSGSLPFKGANTMATLRMHCQDEPAPLGERVPGIPAGVAAWIARAMNKPPEARFRDAGEMRRAMAEGLASSGGTTPEAARAPVSSPVGRKRLWLVGGAVAGLLLLLAVVRSWRKEPALPEAVLSLGGQTLRGTLLGIASLADGGHRIRLRVDGREREILLGEGQEASLALTPPTPR
jgi:serine/threonine-protein kinase